MRKNKKKNMILFLLLLVLGVTVGYAFLNTTLNINGTSKISNAKWNVYWDNPQVTTGSVTDTKPTIDSNKTTATFDITLNNPKDFYEFTIDAVNAGTIDAMIKVNGVSNKVYSDSGKTEETTLPDVIKYTVTYEDGGTISDKHLLAKKSGDTPTRETYKVRIEYRNDEQTTAADLEEITSDTTYYMTFSVEYVQAENAIEAHPTAITYITRQNEGQITPGDVIGIGDTEDFYVISSDSEKTVLFAKYNLLVGNITDGATVVGRAQADTVGYGLQSIDAVGGYNTDSFPTAVAFSSSNYWDENGTLLNPYNANGASYNGNPYPYVYDNSLKTGPDFMNCHVLEDEDYDECYNFHNFNTPGYSIAYYVEEYVDRLKEMGLPSTTTGRLLSYEEATNASSIEDNGKSIIFNGYSSWLGSANADATYGNWVIDLYYQDTLQYTNYSEEYFYGVRPVIEIPTSELQ